MSGEKTILPPNFASIPHIEAFDLTFANRLSLLNIENIITNLVDTVPENVLPWLAKQFDVEGYRGWKLTENTQQRRDLIKQSIELHKYKGTIYGMKQAIKSVGFADVEILEGVLGAILLCNGVAICNGEFTCGEGDGTTQWACFNVIFDLGLLKGITADSTGNLRAIVNEYKNQRSRLLNINFEANVTEIVEYQEVFQMQLPHAPIIDDFSNGNGFLCNGVYRCNGHRCGSGVDYFQITILP